MPVLPGRPAAAGGHVVATCRDPANATALNELAARHPDRLTVVKLDVESTPTIKDAAETVRDKLGRVDVLCQTAAVLHVDTPDFKMRPETSIARLDEAAALKAYRVNALGPTLVTKHFAGLLTEGTRLSLAESLESERRAYKKTNTRSSRTSPLACRAWAITNSAGGTPTALRKPRLTSSR
jgi:NAD(P)-dependent dehydrogenase (short-subunit alcohol dehydrogenase family)